MGFLGADRARGLAPGGRTRGRGCGRPRALSSAPLTFSWLFPQGGFGRRGPAGAKVSLRVGASFPSPRCDSPRALRRPSSKGTAVAARELERPFSFAIGARVSIRWRRPSSQLLKCGFS